MKLFLCAIAVTLCVATSECESEFNNGYGYPWD